jgi:tetratricopeptide (TPR) repeat protein
MSFDAQDRLRKAQLLVGDKAAAQRTVARLIRISPSEPEPWYLAGRAAFDADDKDEAIRDWRNCLKATPRFLPEILAAMKEKKSWLESPKIRSELFSEDPALLKQAADTAVEKKMAGLEKPLLEDAAAILARSDRSPEQDWMLGKIYLKLDDNGKAIDAMRRAWKARPRQFAWGKELTEQLVDAEQFDEAFNTCRAVQSTNPGSAAQLDELLKEIALKKARRN